MKAVLKVKPKLKFSTPKVLLNTTPYLIYYDDRKNTVNMPIWPQVIAQQQEFFYKLAGDKKEGKKVFGLLFNGFYLPHELGHALWAAAGNSFVEAYDSEYFANTLAILYWRKIGKEKELATAYRYAKKFFKQLPNPVPTGEQDKVYFKTNYEKLANDPYQYGYFQFSQFVKIYEDKNLPTFDEFVRLNIK